MTKEENQLLTQVEADAPMGAMMRNYWAPAVRSARLEADGAPARIRLFGENFVAFRATDGRVGFFAEGCPHRCTSLALARNEDNALTCIFHGWKMDVSGKVVDVPSEPPERRAEFAAKVRVSHYPVREAGGVVWVWLGKGEQPPAFPNFEFASLPANQVFALSAKLNCNWLQALELQLDPGHFDYAARRAGGGNGDNPPTIEVERTPYGYHGVAVREQPDGSRYARVTEWVAPWYAFLPAAPGEIHWVSSVAPVDNEQSVLWLIACDPAKPLETDKLRAEGLLDRDPDNFAAGVTTDIGWGKSGSATAAGGRGARLLDDIVLPVGQGHVQNLATQRLGASDAMVARAREILLEAVSAYRKGETAFAPDAGIAYDKIRATAGSYQSGGDWHTLAR